jgi:hypothetical protein
MCKQAIAPELVLCSTARRARETAERIRPSFGTTPVRDESDPYGASAAALLERLRSVPDGVASVLLIGHNPAIAELARDIARPSPQRRELHQGERDDDGQITMANRQRSSRRRPPRSGRARVQAVGRQAKLRIGLAATRLRAPTGGKRVRLNDEGGGA